MMRRIPLAGVAISPALGLIVAGGFCMGGSDNVQAAEKKKHPSAPNAQDIDYVYVESMLRF